MTRRMGFYTANAIVGLLNLTAPIFFSVPRFVTLPISLVVGAIGGNAIYNALKGRRNGRDRQAEENPHDPDSCPLCATFTTPTSGYYSIGGAVSLPSLYYAGSSTNAVAPEPEAEIERVESDLPILAHRSAALRFDGTTSHFGSVNSPLGNFGVDADATCGDLYGYAYAAMSMRYGGGHRAYHEAPALGCSCGFYALPPDMRSTYQGRGYVTLLVELSGTVIEHDEGYRAGHQRVIECQLPSCCYCGNQADVVLVAEHVMQEATCVGHTPKLAEGQVVLDIDAVTRLLPVPVTRLGSVHVDA